MYEGVRFARLLQLNFLHALAPARSQVTVLGQLRGRPVRQIQALAGCALRCCRVQVAGLRRAHRRLPLIVLAWRVF